MIEDCPNCSAVWGMDEMDEQRCFACGYPNQDESWDQNDFDFDDDFDPWEVDVLP